MTVFKNTLVFISMVLREKPGKLKEHYNLCYAVRNEI